MLYDCITGRSEPCALSPPLNNLKHTNTADSSKSAATAKIKILFLIDFFSPERIDIALSKMSYFFVTITL